MENLIYYTTYSLASVAIPWAIFYAITSLIKYRKLDVKLASFHIVGISILMIPFVPARFSAQDESPEANMAKTFFYFLFAYISVSTLRKKAKQKTASMSSNKDSENQQIEEN